MSIKSTVCELIDHCYLENSVTQSAKSALRLGSEVTSAGVAPSQSHGSLVMPGEERRYRTTSAWPQHEAIGATGQIIWRPKLFDQ